MRESKRDYWAIGLMTGTALDGFVDIALLKTDGDKIIELGPYDLVEYTAEDRNTLSLAVNAALEWQFKGEAPEIIKAATKTITRIYSNTVNQFIEKHNLERKGIDFVGGHGLTLLHHPPINQSSGQTLQILDGQILSDNINIPVVYDFRRNDMKNGGQGAPLAPIYHAALLKYANINAPAAILNLGGVANLTYWNGENDVAAFDCGPANGPINEWVELHNMGSFDRNGAFASKGKVNMDLLNEVMANQWFSQKFPKSLDRYDFGAKLVAGLSFEDGCATLSALVGMAVSRGLELFDTKIKTLVVAGGGRKNPIMMKYIGDYTKVELVDSDDVALRGDAVEAECFAFLSVRHALGLPLSFPKTTGVKEPATGGVLALPKSN